MGVVEAMYGTSYTPPGHFNIDEKQQNVRMQKGSSVGKSWLINQHMQIMVSSTPNMTCGGTQTIYSRPDYLNCLKQ